MEYEVYTYAKTTLVEDIKAYTTRFLSTSDIWCACTDSFLSSLKAFRSQYITGGATMRYINDLTFDIWKWWIIK